MFIKYLHLDNTEIFLIKLATASLIFIFDRWFELNEEERRWGWFSFSCYGKSLVEIFVRNKKDSKMEMKNIFRR